MRAVCAMKKKIRKNSVVPKTKENVPKMRRNKPAKTPKKPKRREKMPIFGKMPTLRPPKRMSIGLPATDKT